MKIKRFIELLQTLDVDKDIKFEENGSYFDFPIIDDDGDHYTLYAGTDEEEQYAHLPNKEGAKK